MSADVCRGRVMKCLMVMKCWALIVWLSCKWIFRINLGDLVWYQGRKHVVCNGTTPHHWDIADYQTGDRVWVHERDLRKVWTSVNMAGSFTSGYRFYMNSWFNIWVRDGVQPWMRRLNIW